MMAFYQQRKDIYLYLFKLDEEIYLMDEAPPIRVKVQGMEFEGYSIYSEGFEMLLALENFIGGGNKIS